VSLSAYARRRGVSIPAIQRAIKERRLEASVAMVNGKHKIADVALADREWTERTRPARVDRPGQVAAAAALAEPVTGPPRRVVFVEDEELAADLEVEAGPRFDDEPEPAADSGIPYHEARRRREVEAARREAIKREGEALELALRKGELVPADEARATVVDLFSTVRTKLLGVAARVKQRLPHVAHEDVREIDSLVREALEDLAEGRDGG
jgi:phage terminase Nu1 subunit (DNA packaging protein)